ncbi:hypothetical protein [Xanthomonas pisi]|uniref:hypothetical protein n=1 Tax=Xanthomonas pisi TaxID=56457 RepID=UPI000B063C91|nr:hypothetical protein [Xanthomonas pisi]
MQSPPLLDRHIALQCRRQRRAAPAAGHRVAHARQIRCRSINDRYYRNTDQSHAFERETKIDAKPVSGSDIKVDTIIGTRNAQIQGDNVSAYRTRVRRESD